MTAINDNGQNTIVSKRFPANKQLFERGLAVQELICNKPGFLIRWGVTIFLFILIGIITATWFIQYPDVVTAKAKLISLNAPKAIISKSDGQLIMLFPKEGDAIKKDAVIGYMESIANPQTVLQLSAILDSFQNAIKKNNNESVFDFFETKLIASRSELGELQQSHQAFVQSFVLFRSYLSKGFYLRKRSMLMKDIETLQHLGMNLYQEKVLKEKDLDLTQQTFSANEQLKNDSVISEFEYRTEKSKLLNKKIIIPQISSAIVSNEGQQNEKRKEIMELGNQIAEQKNIFLQALNTFISQVDEWKKRYLLISPISGKVAFPVLIQEHQQLHANQTICFVNPENSEYYAEVYVPQFNLGKVKAGQKVLLKFPSYPFEEYGSLAGKIEFISTVPSDSGYFTKAELVNGLTTSYNKTIQYREGLLGQGEIITQNRRLLERFYYNLIKKIKE